MMLDRAPITPEIEPVVIIKSCTSLFIGALNLRWLQIDILGYFRHRLWLPSALLEIVERLINDGNACVEMLE